MSQQNDATVIKDLAFSSDSLLQEQVNQTAYGDHSMVIPEGFRLVSIEHLQPVKKRFDGEFVCRKIKDFNQYLQNFDYDGIGFIDTENIRAEVILDIGSNESPGHCHHSAVVVLNKTSEFNSCLNSNGMKLDQDDLYNWLIDWSDFLSVSDDEMELVEAMQRIRNIDLSKSENSSHRIDDMSASRSSSANIEAKSAENKKLPKGFVFSCFPYDGLQKVYIDLRLSVHIKNETPILSIRIDKMDVLVDNIGEDFYSTMKDSFVGTLLSGTFKTL